jgi:hypothetical protein
MPLASPRPSVPENQPGVALGLILIAILVALLFAALGATSSNSAGLSARGTILLGIYIVAVGSMFLASYYFSHKTFFLRALIWVCEKGSFPASRKMAFFYFSLSLFIGVSSLISGIRAL